MPVIKPIENLQDPVLASEISAICHKDDEPVFLTKNGEGDMVIMSLATYEKQRYMIELYAKLSEAEAESNLNITKSTHEEVMQKIKAQINGKKI